MSCEAPFSIVPLELATSRDLTLEEIRVLIALFSWRGKNTNVVWPKRESLGKRCGYSPKKISEVTASLVKKGWLEKSGNGGRSMPSQYRITVPEQGTVPESETAPQSGNKTVPEQGNKTVPESGEGKEQTMEVTMEQTIEEARSNHGTPSSITEPPPQPSSVAATRRGRRKERTEIDADAVLSDHWADEALKINPQCKPVDLWPKFVNHHRSRGNVMADWLAAWRTWIHKDIEFSKTRGTYARTPASRIDWYSLDF